MGEELLERGVGDEPRVRTYVCKLEDFERGTEMSEDVRHRTVVGGNRGTRASKRLEPRRQAIPHEVAPVPYVRAPREIENFDALYRSVQHGYHRLVVHVRVAVSMPDARRLHGHRNFEHAQVFPARVFEIFANIAHDAPS